MPRRSWSSKPGSIHCHGGGCSPPLRQSGGKSSRLTHGAGGSGGCCWRRQSCGAEPHGHQTGEQRSLHNITRPLVSVYVDHLVCRMLG